MKNKHHSFGWLPLWLAIFCFIAVVVCPVESKQKAVPIDQAATEKVSTARSGHWPVVRKAHIKAHPNCACCGRPAQEVHHIQPFHLHPELELDDTNLISLCEKCHLVIEHLRDWKSCNPHVVEDAAYIRSAIDEALVGPGNTLLPGNSGCMTNDLIVRNPTYLNLDADGHVERKEYKK